MRQERYVVLAGKKALRVAVLPPTPLPPPFPVPPTLGDLAPV